MGLLSSTATCRAHANLMPAAGGGGGRGRGPGRDEYQHGHRLTDQSLCLAYGTIHFTVYTIKHIVHSVYCGSTSPLIQSTVYTAAGSYQAPNQPPIVAEGCPLYKDATSASRQRQ